MSPEQSRSIVAEIEATSAQAKRLVESIDKAAFVKRPSPESWSAAECLQHLVITSRAMRPLVDEALTELERKNARSDAKSGLGFVGWLLVKMLEPPARFKTKTPAQFVPVEVPDTVLATLLDENEKLVALAKRAAGLKTADTRIVSPFNASAKYNVYAALRITATHLRRHIWQAEQARDALKAR